MRYKVDVKAFISVVVEADDEDAARSAADALVERLAPNADFIDGFNRTDSFAPQVEETSGFDVDGESEVEEYE